MKQGMLDRDPFDACNSNNPGCYCEECRFNRKDGFMRRLFNKWRRRQGKKIIEKEISDNNIQ